MTRKPGSPGRPVPSFVPARTLAVLLVSALAAGCLATRPPDTSPRGSATPLPELSARQIIDRLPAFPEELATLSAEADVAVSSPRESGRFRARIAYRRADSMLVRVRFPLGIEGARVLVTPDSAFIYDRIEEVLYAGLPHEVERQLPVALAGTDLVDLATGFVLLGDESDWVVESDSVFYRVHSPSAGMRATIDPTLWRIVNMVFSDTEGTILEQRWYMDFTDFNGITVPRRMSLSRPSADTRLTMTLRRLNPSPDALSFDLGVAPGTPRIIMEE